MLVYHSFFDFFLNIIPFYNVISRQTRTKKNNGGKFSYLLNIAKVIAYLTGFRIYFNVIFLKLIKSYFTEGISIIIKHYSHTQDKGIRRSSYYTSIATQTRTYIFELS